VSVSTTERSLAVLAALQARPTWTGPELADRMGVTVRTVRRDVDRLRSLGYPIEAELGAAGGYHLGVGGAAVPPLMLATEEAFALAVCVRAAGTSVAGVAGDADRALAKLEQLLPASLRAQVDVVGDALIRVDTRDEPVDARLLRVMSRACRSGERLAVRYRDRSGRETERRLEPFRVVSIGRRWYLVARDVDLGEWRTWRVDRVAEATATGHRFRLDDPPDPVALVQRAISVAPYRYTVRVEIGASVAEVEARIPPSVAVCERVDAHTALLTTGGDDLDVLALHVVLIGLPFRVLEPAAFVERLAAVAARCSAAVAASAGV